MRLMTLMGKRLGFHRPSIDSLGYTMTGRFAPDVDIRAGSALTPKRTSARVEHLYCLARGLNGAEFIPTAGALLQNGQDILNGSATELESVELGRVIYQSHVP
jgi:hypothetical protein